MNNKCKVTVAVISYNPVWEKLRNTLKSVVWQEEVDFEIIVADDGSEKDCFDLVEQFFKEKNFANYKLVKNPVNQGIVKNVLSAVNVAQGKYIKLISPGDFLYDENTLHEFVDFAEKNPAAFYFGNMFSYSLDEDGQITVYNEKKNPRDIRPWLAHDIKKIRKNYLVLRDYICGATAMYDTRKLSAYLTEISPFVSFAEDFSMFYMVANGENGYYMNVKGGVWYEYGSGITTQKSDAWSERVRNDSRNLCKYLIGKGLLPKWNYRMNFSEKLSTRRFFRMIHAPQTYIAKLFKLNLIRGYECINFNVNKLEKILEK